MDQQSLIDTAGRLADVAVKAQDWINNNEERVRNCGSSSETILANLRKQARVARKLGRAAGRRMCAGVFGPSQAGKSYLLSSLARDADGKVMARFDKETHDFLEELNPFGGKESTGLVTRFTLTAPEGVTDEFPVHVRLFSETELVKIFANSYYRDCEHKAPVNKEAIKAGLDKLKAKAGGQANPSINLDSLEDLREYVTGSFGGLSRAAALEEVYWPEAIKLAPKLAIEDRAELFGLIWDGIQEFNEMFLSLARDLEKLGNDEEAFCEMSALIPREASVIDVETLGRSDFSKWHVGDSIRIKGKNGKTASIARKNATAIIAELTLVMTNKPANYFDHTDLLDFPGYKARLECSDIRDYLKKGKEDSAVEQFFRRGKVDYLFQRYNAENELTSLLLCVATTDQTPGLAGAIEEWIISTHGRTPEARANSRTALFYILTKADRYFEEKKGSMAELWENTIEGNFLAHFGNRCQATQWVQNWKPGKPFNNLFLLRNVNVKFGAVMKYQDKQGVAVEMGIQEDRKKYVEDLREAFIESPSVKKHFAAPSEAFDELMKLNDGGMEHIKNALEPLCDPDLKLGQIDQALGVVAQTLVGFLSPFYHSGDQEVELKKKMAFFASFGRLFKNPYFQERFPELLNNFKIPPDQLFYLRPEADRQYEEYKAEALAELQEEVEKQPEPAEAADGDPLDFLDDMFDAAPAPAQGAGTPLKAGDKDEYYFYAQRIIDAWDARMRSLADNGESKDYYQFTRPVFLGMLDELDQAVARLNLRDKLTNKFREIAEPVDVPRESKIRKQAAYAIGVLNDFVSWLGKNPADSAESQRKVDYRGENVLVFKDKPAIREYPELPETFTPFSRQWYKDWLTAFYGMLVDNVTYSNGTQIDLEQNSRLGALLKRINGEGAGA